VRAPEVEVEVEVLMLGWALRCDDCDTLLRSDLISAVAVGSVVATRKQNTRQLKSGVSRA
jgi:hypothetical protein